MQYMLDVSILPHITSVKKSKDVWDTLKATKDQTKSNW